MLILTLSLGIQKATGLCGLDYSGWSDFLPFHLHSSLPTTSAKLQPPGKMIRHLLSHLQHIDILKIPDKVVSTALMAAAGAVRSSGFIFIVGDETQGGLVPQASLEAHLGCWGLAHFSPHNGQTTEHGHKTRQKWPSTDTSQDLTFRERRKEDIAHLRNVPDP